MPGPPGPTRRLRRRRQLDADRLCLIMTAFLHQTLLDRSLVPGFVRAGDACVFTKAHRSVVECGATQPPSFPAAHNDCRAGFFLLALTRTKRRLISDKGLVHVSVSHERLLFGHASVSSQGSTHHDCRTDGCWLVDPISAFTFTNSSTRLCAASSSGVYHRESSGTVGTASQCDLGGLSPVSRRRAPAIATVLMGTNALIVRAKYERPFSVFAHAKSWMPSSGAALADLITSAGLFIRSNSGCT
jgi:hypothetical protein